MRSGRCYAIMTVCAGSQYLGVIDGVRRHPDVGVVAAFTGVGGLNMCRIFACRVRTVVAVAAVRRDVGMIEIRR